MSGFPAPIVVGAQGHASAVVIMLHGLGDTGNGWADIPNMLGIPWIKWIFPTAKTRPVTINMGERMPAWFDISMGTLTLEPSSIDRVGIEESVSYVRDLVHQEVQQGFPMSRVVVGGFSQGGNIAVHTALDALGGKIGGCMGLSTFIDLTNDTIFPDEAKGMPIALFHGMADGVVPFPVGKISYETLKKKGLAAEFKYYPGMDHTASDKELMDVKSFLLRVLPEHDSTHEEVCADQLEKMSVAELKAFLSKRHVDYSDCVEKKDLRERAKSHL